MKKYLHFLLWHLKWFDEESHGLNRVSHTHAHTNTHSERNSHTYTHNLYVNVYSGPINGDKKNKDIWNNVLSATLVLPLTIPSEYYKYIVLLTMTYPPIWIGQESNLLNQCIPMFYLIAKFAGIPQLLVMKSLFYTKLPGCRTRTLLKKSASRRIILESVYNTFSL